MPPAPKHPSQRVRRNKDLPMNQLPGDGRKGRTPVWPLSAAGAAEAKAWKAAWKLPQAVVIAISQAAKVLGVHCVAKRVDTQVGRQWLSAIGIDFAQGFLLEKPQPLEDLALPGRQAALSP